MYLIDTNVISEARKGGNANAGVRKFFSRMARRNIPLFISVVTVGELRRGVELIRYRGDIQQAQRLEYWLTSVLAEYADAILDLDADVAQVWGRLCVPQSANSVDKQIAATALIHNLIVVTRNGKDFSATGAQVLNPFVGAVP